MLKKLAPVDWYKFLVLQDSCVCVRALVQKMAQWLPIKQASIGQITSPICPHCGTEEETAEHLLLSCAQWAGGHRHHFGDSIDIIMACLGGAVDGRRTRDRKVASSTPAWGAIKSTRSTQPSIPLQQVSRVPAYLAGVKVGCVHLCWVAGNAA